MREAARQYYAENTEAVRERSRAWAHANPERKKRREHAAYLRDRESKIEQARKWREANPVRARETARIYRERNRERVNAAKRRYRELKAVAFVAVVRRQEIFARDAGRCGVCGQAVDVERFELDHIVPISAGGTDEPANVQLAHPRCNKIKGAKQLA